MSVNPSPLEIAVLEVFRSAASDHPRINPTELYCEGWLLRLVLSALEHGIRCLPFVLEPQSRWFAEPRLYSAFRGRYRSDSLKETHTKADAVVGHFHFGRTKSGLHLTPSATQFVVLEAKMYSKLSGRTKNAENFDQASRYIGCMAEVLKRASRPLSTYHSLGFYVIAPQSKIDQGVFTQNITPQSIQNQLLSRIEGYEPDAQPTYHQWFKTWVLPLLERCQIACISWEQILRVIRERDGEYGALLDEFYANCLRFNGPMQNEGVQVPGQPFRVCSV
jgi:hypothetical protein